MAGMPCNISTLMEETCCKKHEQWMARYGRVYRDNEEKEHGTGGIKELLLESRIMVHVELVDYDRSGEDQGCGGGYMDGGFTFIIKNKGINTEAAYPYKAEDATCNTKEESIHAAKITGHEDVPVNSERTSGLCTLT
ncbi:senescence-specific cysteine protease SAG39-like protein [Tanacetum coccineum]